MDNSQRMLEPGLMAHAVHISKRKQRSPLRQLKCPHQRADLTAAGRREFTHRRAFTVDHIEKLAIGGDARRLS